MLPAVLDILTWRLEKLDRKRMTGIAKIRCDLWNIHRNLEERPDPYEFTDFLPETAADRRRRAKEEADAMQMPSKEELEAYKRSLFSGMKITSKSAAS